MRGILRFMDGIVTLRYHDAKTSEPVTRTLAGEDFFWLLLQHVLPKEFQRARNVGFLHHNSDQALHLLQLLHFRPLAGQVSDQATAERPL